MANLNAPVGNRKIYRLETSVLEFLHNFRKEKQFSRTVEVYHLNKKEDNEYYKLLCTEFLFKDEENADVILLKKLSYLWDEVEVLVNIENRIVAIVNLSEIKLRWIEISDSLSTAYKGLAIESYFLTINELLEVEEKVCDFLNSPKMYGMLFNGLSLQHFPSERRERKITEHGIEVLETTSQVNDGKKGEIRITAIQTEITDILGYNRIYHYDNTLLIEGYVAIKKKEKEMRHSLLWIG